MRWAVLVQLYDFVGLNSRLFATRRFEGKTFSAARAAYERERPSDPELCDLEERGEHQGRPGFAYRRVVPVPNDS